MARKSIKLGVRVGGGPPPGYRWHVEIVDRAFDEAMTILDAAQYRHLAMQVKLIARQDDPTRSGTVDIDAVETYHEIRDCGGILGNLNVRVFFGVDKARRTIVVLGVFHKRNNGPTPVVVRKRIRERWGRHGG